MTSVRGRFTHETQLRTVVAEFQHALTALRFWRKGVYSDYPPVLSPGSDFDVIVVEGMAFKVIGFGGGAQPGVGSKCQLEANISK